jgi:hypothetical protein
MASQNSNDTFYTADFGEYKKVHANGGLDRVENGNENAGNIQVPITPTANNPRYVSPQSFLDNINTRYQI